MNYTINKIKNHYGQTKQYQVFDGESLIFTFSKSKVKMLQKEKNICSEKAVEMLVGEKDSKRIEKIEKENEEKRLFVEKIEREAEELVALAKTVSVEDGVLALASRMRKEHADDVATAREVWKEGERRRS